MIDKQEYNSITHVGATPEDCRVIHLALIGGKEALHRQKRQNNR